jgi:hypothetical protein
MRERAYVEEVHHGHNKGIDNSKYNVGLGKCQWLLRGAENFEWTDLIAY